MHSTLPNYSEKLAAPFDGLLASVLSEQQDLTAVERFAYWHDRTGHGLDGDAANQTPALAKHYSSLMPATAPTSGQQYAFEVDLDTCSGCKACVVACHNLNGLETEETWRKVGWLTSQSANLPIVQHVTTACHHCVEPACLSGCPVKAYEKDPLTGIVRHLDDQCFGCKYCTMMCPYEVPQYSSTLGIVRKCDMCHQRLSHGEAPACVQACPNEAIRITVVQSLDIRESCTGTSTLLPTAPPSHFTIPTTIFLSSRMKLTDEVVSLEAVVDHPHESHWPLVAMLVLSQASVGMWCIMSLQLLVSNRTVGELAWSASIATALGVVGVHLALLHLGRPWLAYRAFLGWRTSWLSREAIAFGIYMAIASLAAFGFLAPRSDQAYEFAPVVFKLADGLFPYCRPLAVASASIGLVAIACSGMIYIATGRSLWNMRRTSIEFTATTLGLGLASGAAIDPNAVGPWIMLIGVLCAGTGLIAKLHDQWRSRSALTDTYWNDFSRRSGRLLDRQLSHAWKAATMSWLGAVGVAGMLCLNCVATTFVPFAFILTLALLGVSQLLNRWLYFASLVTYRMPGAST